MSPTVFLVGSISEWKTSDSFGDKKLVRPEKAGAGNAMCLLVPLG